MSSRRLCRDPRPSGSSRAEGDSGDSSAAGGASAQRPLAGVGAIAPTLGGDALASAAGSDLAHPTGADVFLQPGDYFVGDASHRIRTLLGSCVSVTLWSPQLRIGAMSHFLLASRGGRTSDAADPASLDARYGDEALRLMLQELKRKKLLASQCHAKIFGGGDMFPAHKTSGALAIGRRNGEAARSLLQARGIEVVSESLFGAGHRQIVFDVASGHVWSRQVPPRPAAPAGSTGAGLAEGPAE